MKCLHVSRNQIEGDGFVTFAPAQFNSNMITISLTNQFWVTF